MKFVKLWLPVVIWAGLIFYLSSIPNLKTNLEYDYFLRKLAHIIEYFIFAALFYRAFKGSFKVGPFRLFMYPAVFSLLYAISDEIHQYFVLGRNCAMQDVLIDSLGIICFFVFIKTKKGHLCLTK